MKRMKKQAGQAVIEAVLFLVLFTGLGMLVTNTLRENDFVNKLVSQPWQMLSGMIECGVWTGCKKGSHPAAYDRVLSYQPAD